MLELITCFDADNIQGDILIEESTEIFTNNISFKTNLYIELRPELLRTWLLTRNRQKDRCQSTDWCMIPFELK